jgi:hypothetical protein
MRTSTFELALRAGKFGTSAALFALVAAPTFAQAVQFNTVYQCRPPITFKFYSCTGTKASDTCDVQSFNAGRPFQRGRSTYAQVMQLLQQCHLQTPAEAQAEASGAVKPIQPGQNPGGAGAAGTGPGGFKVGDRVRILINGWQEGTVVQIRGNTYVVRLPGGIDVPKIWPNEVRRIGQLTAADHAVGQYDLHDRVQALYNGKWTEGEIVGEQYATYTVKLPGVVTSRDFGDQDTINVSPQNIRMSTTPPPPPPAKRAAGQAPKPGMASCGSKYDGRWESTSGFAGNRVVFRGGKATVTAAMSPPIEYDCFISDGKILLFKPGSFTPDEEPLEINDDGTIQTPLGAIKKMGK